MCVCSCMCVQVCVYVCVCQCEDIVFGVYVASNINVVSCCIFQEHVSEGLWDLEF